MNTLKNVMTSAELSSAGIVSFWCKRNSKFDGRLCFGIVQKGRDDVGSEIAQARKTVPKRRGEAPAATTYVD